MARNTGKTARGLDARERARAARLRLDQEREERDRAIEEVAAEFFTADDARTDLLRQLAAIESTMATSVERLRDLGESTQRITGLLDLDAKEVRRLLTLSPANDADTASAGSDGPSETPHASDGGTGDGGPVADQPAA